MTVENIRGKSYAEVLDVANRMSMRLGHDVPSGSRDELIEYIKRHASGTGSSDPGVAMVWTVPSGDQFVDIPDHVWVMPEDEDRGPYDTIFNEYVPEVIDFFRRKSEHYRSAEGFMTLGAKGQFADINRKFWPLKQAIWEGRPLTGEQPDEIIKDLIGHCFLMLWCLRNEGEAS